MCLFFQESVLLATIMPIHKTNISMCSYATHCRASNMLAFVGVNFLGIAAISKGFIHKILCWHGLVWQSAKA